MDVEIDDGDTADAELALRMARADGRVVEEAEAHRPADFGVVAGGAGRDEGVVGAAHHHGLDGGDRAPGRAQHRLQAAR